MPDRKALKWNMETMPLSKSACQIYEQCRHRFKLSVIEGKEGEKGEQLIKGLKWHELLYGLYGKVDRVAIMRARRVDEEYRKYLPEDLITQNLIDIENDRLEYFIERDKHEYFWPILLEQFYVDPRHNYFGTLDRIDKEIDTTFVVIDYKTGKYHEYMMSKYRFELAGYKHLVESNTKMKVKKGCIFFLEEKKVVCEEISSITMRAFYAKLNRIRERIKEGHFEKNLGQLCAYCPFAGGCLIEDDALMGQVMTNGYNDG